MTVMQQIRSDLAQRKNLDTYAAITVAIIATVLSAFDLLPPDKTTSVVMGILAVLAFSTLTTRALVENAAGVSSDRFQPNFPPSQVTQRAECSDLLLIGVSLGRTIRTSFGDFETNLSRGAKLRVILTDPDADGAAIDARCQRSRPGVDEIRQEIRASLGLLERLKGITNGDLEVRLTKSALKFGVNYFYPDTSRAEIHVQLYSYRLSGESRPHFILTPRDGEWFECFREQVETLWQDSRVFQGQTTP
jgi:hypothetical protein